MYTVEVIVPLKLCPARMLTTSLKTPDLFSTPETENGRSVI